MNTVQLQGHVGGDPETREIGGTSVTKFSIATNQSWKDKAGEWQEEVMWHTVKAWGNQSDAAQTLSKGDLVIVQGMLKYEEYNNKDGAKQRVAIVRAGYIGKLQKPEKRTAQTGAAASAAEQGGDDDDLPF